MVVAHELVYPWGRRGWRGFLHAVTHRVALLPLVAASDVLVVTTPERLEWVASRGWLPARPVRWAPVFSNLSVVTPAPDMQGPPTVGVFGFGHETDRRELVVNALAAVAAALPGAELVMLGSPGPASSQGQAWREAARIAGCPLRFTGVLPSDDLSRALSGLSALVFFDDAGPTARKTTLAAALAHGVPTVALDGPDRWVELIKAHAVEVVPPDARSLAEALTVLLTDKQKRQRLATDGRVFYEQSMSSAIAAHRVEEAITLAHERRRQGVSKLGRV